VAQQRDEIISEAEAQKLTEEDKNYYINYKTYVDLNDKITIDYYQENGQQDLAQPVSGVNTGLIENNDQRNTSGGGAMVVANQDNQIKKDDPVKFLLEYFQKNNIKQISLNSERELNIEYNGDNQKTEIANNNVVKGYLAQIGQESLNYSQLSALTMQNNSSSSPQNQNLDKVLKIGGGVIIISAVAALGYC